MAVQYSEKLQTSKAVKWHNTTQYSKEYANDTPSAAGELFGMSENDLRTQFTTMSGKIGNTEGLVEAQGKAIDKLDAAIITIHAKIDAGAKSTSEAITGLKEQMARQQVINGVSIWVAGGVAGLIMTGIMQGILLLFKKI